MGPGDFVTYIASTQELCAELRRKLDQAQRTESTVTRQTSCDYVSLALSYLGFLHQRILEAKNPSSESDHRLARKLVSACSKQLGFPSQIYTSLSDSYFTTGSFMYYKRFGIRPRKEYYIVSLDFTDSAVLWPLVCHEVAHCWLSRTDLVETVAEMVALPSSDQIRSLETRVEEALCDSIATRLGGTSFPFAFAIKFWGEIPMVETGEHPYYSFRLELMARTLEGMGMFEQAADIRDILAQANGPSWETEAIAGLMPQIVTKVRDEVPRGMAGSGMGLLPGTDVLDRCWTQVYEAGGLNSSILASYSTEFKQTLERWTMPSDSGA